MDRTNFTKEAFHDIYPRLLLRRKVGHFLQQAKSWIRHFPSNSRTALHILRQRIRHAFHSSESQQETRLPTMDTHTQVQVAWILTTLSQHPRRGPNPTWPERTHKGCSSRVKSLADVERRHPCGLSGFAPGPQSRHKGILSDFKKIRFLTWQLHGIAWVSSVWRRQRNKKLQYVTAGIF
jgi:hypothetical protein